MRILFYMRAVRQLRPYKSIFKSFSKHGHTVLVVLDPREKQNTSTETLDLFKQETPGFGYIFGIRRSGQLRKIIFPVRELRTYRRYLLHPEQVEFYRERWKKFLPVLMQKWISGWPRLSAGIIKTKAFDQCLKLIERAVPPVKAIIKQIIEYSPDAIFIAYRNMPSAALDLEYLKAAKHLKIPSIIPVLSWDTLTTKGLVQIRPDRIFVWNEEQVSEIEDHHSIPKNLVKIVGAYQFDNWLSYKTPTVLREEFCRKYGLRSEDPIILYFGFSYGIKDKRISGGHGPAVVEKLRQALDASNDPRLKKVQIIVRPHPMHTHQFADMNIRDTIILPKTNTLMNRKDDFDLLFDSVYHSIAAIAINTTAIIDVSIQMKPGIVLHWEEYRQVQGGTHFKNFLSTGAVAVSENAQDFVEIIIGLLDKRDPVRPKREAYFRTFIRPRDPNILSAEFVISETVSFVNSRIKKQ